MTPPDLPDFTWMPIEIVEAGLLYFSYILITVYMYKKIKGRHPDWEGLAELLSALPALMWLFLGSFLLAVY